MKILKTFIIVFAFLGISTAFAADKIYTGTFGNTALKGYDTVAYFSEGQPAKGSSNFTTEWNGAQWQFSSQKNLDLFKANPSRYAPQYGGYCAFAVAHNQLAPGDPTQWHIENGKLYLNLNSNIQEQWLGKRSSFISQANQNYPSLVK